MIRLTFNDLIPLTQNIISVTWAKRFKCRNFNTAAFFKKGFYLFIFRERGREGEREGDKHQCVVASRASPTGDLAHKPGMCPDWESNRQPFSSQAGAPSTEPHQPRLNTAVLITTENLKHFKCTYNRLVKLIIVYPKDIMLCIMCI